MSYEVMPKARCVRAVAVFVLFGAIVAPLAAKADPPTPLNVLFVANGNYSQETYIQNHLIALGATVAKMKDYQVKSTTNFAAYNLILITEFAPNISSTALIKLKTAGVPVLIVEYWDFWYSYKLGLTTTDDCGYVGATNVEMVNTSARVAEYVGKTPQVYTTSYTIYGISEFDLKPGVEPLAWSSASFGEHAMIIDRARKIAATGVYDTRRYTVESWILFDEIVREIAPLGPRWGDDQETLQGFVESGLWSYIDGLRGTEPEASVRAYVWPRVFAYNLHDALITIEYAIQQKFTENFVFFPPYHLYHPHPAYDSTHDDMRWFLGEHCYDTDGLIEPSDYGVPSHGDKIWGVDLGTSTKLGSSTFFYMGDTWGKLISDIDPQWPEGCVYDSTQGAVECNDSIVRLDPGETDPLDGLDAEVIPSPADTTLYLPQTIPGVHRDYNDEVWDTAWADNHGFSVPVGASSVVKTQTFTVIDPFPPYDNFQYTVSVPWAHLWYATQETRGNDPNDPDADRLAGKSWVGCSINGTSFNNCYRYGTSADYDYAFFSKDRFVAVSPVEIGADEFDAMGDNAPSHGDLGGTLLFASARPYRCSKLFLAYVDTADFGDVDPGTIKPANVQYYKGAAGEIWTELEDEATPIFEPTCLNVQDDFVTEEQQAVWDEKKMITEAIFEEQLWEYVQEDEDVPVGIGYDFSGCDYSGPGSCEVSTCWMFGDAANHICSMCDQDAVDACVATAIASLTAINYPWPATEGFGEVSVKLIKQEGFSAFVMLSNHPRAYWPEHDDVVSAISNGINASPLAGFPADGFDRHNFRWDQGGVFFRWAPTSTPWSWSEAEDTEIPGYGPYIIDEFTSVVTVYTVSGPDVDKLTILQLWFTTSAWHGDDGSHENGMPGAYGVYTAKTSHSWLEHLYGGDPNDD